MPGRCGPSTCPFLSPMLLLSCASSPIASSFLCLSWDREIPTSTGWGVVPKHSWGALTTIAGRTLFCHARNLPETICLASDTKQRSLADYSPWSCKRVRHKTPKHSLHCLCSFVWCLACPSNAGTTEMLLPVLSSGRPVKKTKVHLFLSTMKKVKMKVTQSRLTLCDPMDYTVLRILLDRILE